MSTAAIYQFQKNQESKYVCSDCGASRDCDCNAPAVERVREYDKANPGKSNRATAEAIGVDEKTVRKARADQSAPETVTGRDGKTYAAKRIEKREAAMAATNQINVFLMNCAASVQAAHYNGPMSNRVRAAARRVADAWKILADEMESLR